MGKPDWCPDDEWKLAKGISIAWIGEPHIERGAQDIARALIAARADGMEEAAKVAEEAGNTWSGTRDAEQACQEAAVDEKCEEIAAAIRTAALDMRRGERE